MFDNNTDLRTNDARFLVLAKKLDNLIKNFYMDENILNNPNLLLSRNHPDYLRLWEPVLYKSKIDPIDYLNLIPLLIKSVLYYFFVLAKCILQAPFKQKNQSLFLKHNPVEIILISHAFDDNSQAKDLYFGDLFSELHKADIACNRLLIPHFKYEIKKHYSKQDLESTSTLLNLSMNKSQALKYSIKNISSIIKLIVYCVKKRFSFYETWIVVIGQFLNLENLRIILNISYLIKIIQPKKVIVTFEGNIIERSVFKLCHRLKTKCYGYQHAPIIKSQHAIFQSFGKYLNPDLILTSGNYSQKKFVDSFKTEIPVKILGSSKYQKGQLLCRKVPPLNSILLVPDGNEESVDTFIDLGLYLTSYFNDSKITIRSHPSTMHYLNCKFEKLNPAPNTFDITKNDLDLDLKSCNWVIYQNSSVAIQALMQGKNIVYFKNKYVDVDPLFDLGELRLSAESFENLKNLILSDIKWTKQQQKIRIDFAKNYFSKLNWRNVVL
jgi:hypothetical protein